MQTLADELKRKDLQEMKEKGDEVESVEVDSDWTKCKSAVMGLDENIQQIIKKAHGDGRLNYYTGSKELNRFEVYFSPIHGHEVRFIAYEKSKGEYKGDFKYAYYVAYNPDESLVFKYDLIDEATADDAEKIFS